MRNLLVTADMVLAARQLLAQSKGRSVNSRAQRNLVKMSRVRLASD